MMSFLRSLRGLHNQILPRLNMDTLKIGVQRGRAAKNLMLVVFVMGGLSACNKGPDEASGSIELGIVIREAIAEWRAPEDPPLQINRAFLQQFEQPHLEVFVENRDHTGYMGLGLSREDDLPGLITTWHANDATSLSFRNGMLIATRGLAGNLISARVPAKDGTAGPAHGGMRSYSLLAHDNRERRLTLACALSDLGPQALEIYEKQYNTRHLQERCEGRDPDGRDTVVINDYWVDSHHRKVWKSRQWAGPEIGYLRIRDLSN